MSHSDGQVHLGRNEGVGSVIGVSVFVRHCSVSEQNLTDVRYAEGHIGTI